MATCSGVKSGSCSYPALALAINFGSPLIICSTPQWQFTASQKPGPIASHHAMRVERGRPSSVIYPPGFPASRSRCVCRVSVGAARQGTSPALLIASNPVSVKRAPPACDVRCCGCGNSCTSLCRAPRSLTAMDFVVLEINQLRTETPVCKLLILRRRFVISLGSSRSHCSTAT